MQRANTYQELRLRRELRRERQDRLFFERLTLAAACVAGMMAGTLLAVASAVGMI